MIENIEQAKERFKRLVDFYKLNDPNNYDYDDRDLISMKLVLEEIERLNKHNEELQKERDMYKGSFETMSENYFRLENIIKEVREHIEKEYVQVENKEYNLDWNNLEYIIKEILEILDKENK